MSFSLKKIPKMPLSALVFYLGVLLFWQLGLIPSPAGIFSFLEGLYESYGLEGLFIASFLEGIVYLGLYFPGSAIVMLAVILSDGSLNSLFLISLYVAVALTITSTINYFFGRFLVRSKNTEKAFKKSKRVVSKGFLPSFLHPNALAFYFFNSGIKKHNFFKILLVPVIMIPYGLALGYLFFSLKEVVRSTLETPIVMIMALLIWMAIALILQARK